jgi:23S rRNA pseudouridine1911/1915/1917 synthase
MNEYIVSAEQEGMRLDVFLTEQMEGSRSYIQSLIKGGHVIVGGKVGKANLRLTPNMVIQVEIPEPESVEVKPEDIPLDVLYEDHDIIIVNKARGMVVHPAVGNYSGTLVNALLFHCKDLSGINGEIRPGIVHRLDKDTSGIVIIAKTSVVQHAFDKKHTPFYKTYDAIVEGKLPSVPLTINWPIGRKPGSIIERCCTDQGKLARTDITVISKNTSKISSGKINSDDVITMNNNSNVCSTDNSLTSYNQFTHVRCLLHTGRTHQIRVHLSQLGYPLAGDDLYGGHLEFIQRQALHASHVSFYHPITDEWLELHAKMPEDMKVLLND